MKDFILIDLPIKKEIETTKILKKSINANRALERNKPVDFILDSVFRGEL